MKSLKQGNHPTSEVERSTTSKPVSSKTPYIKPSVERAGSVFLRTQALGEGTKDVISGSTLL